MKKITFVFCLFFLISFALFAAPKELSFPKKGKVLFDKAEKYKNLPMASDSANEIGIPDFSIKYCFNKPRIDIFRQQNFSAISTKKDKKSDKQKDNFFPYDPLCFYLGCGIYVDVNGNIFLNPVEAFDIVIEKSFIDKTGLTPEEKYIQEANYLYAADKKGKKEFLLYYPGIEENQLYGKKEKFSDKNSALIFDETEHKYIYLDVNRAENTVPTSFEYTQGFFRFWPASRSNPTEFSIRFFPKKIEVTKDKQVIKTIIKSDDALIIQDSKIKGILLQRINNVILYSTYGM
jgi:hypothetical protein